jgi:hypothetical protein
MPHAQPDADKRQLSYALPWLGHAMRALFAVSACVVIVVSIARAAVFWANEAYLDDASGNWTALASDLRSGVFYRPLSGPDGFGGSRYFPLHFVLHAGVMRVIGSPIRAGQIVAVAAVVLLMSGTYVLLRRLNVPRLAAGACAAFVLVAHPAQEALLAIKGDGLAAALNVWGFALCIGSASGGAAVMLAPAVFALAFATKVTTISGLGAAVLMWGMSGRWWPALRLLLFSGAGMALVLVLMYAGSHGVVFDVLRASASGGAGVRDFLEAPLTLARQTRRVPETLPFVQLGVASVLLMLLGPRPLPYAPLLFFVCVGAVTTLIFGSPGTDTNHLIDLHVASLVAIGCIMATSLDPYTSFGGSALMVAALAGSLSLVSGLVNARSEQHRGTVAETLALIPDPSRPILAQNPLVPVAAGQRPFLIDPFMIRLQSERDPSFADPLWSAIRQQRFGAVVLERNPDTSRELYRVILGDRFVDEVERAYEPAGHLGQRVVFLPRQR